MVRPLSPLKSPDLRLREVLPVMVRLVMAARSVAVMAAHVDLPATAATMAFRTAAVRMQISDDVTASVCGDSAPLPTLLTARTLKR